MLPFKNKIYPKITLHSCLFLKIFSEENHLNDFLAGNLFMKPVTYFKKLEDNQIRGDEFEGADASYRGSDVYPMLISFRFYAPII